MCNVSHTLREQGKKHQLAEDLGIALINGANVNIWEYFGDKLKDVEFKGCPIFKLLVEPSKGFNIPSGHNDKYRMIVNI